MLSKGNEILGMGLAAVERGARVVEMEAAYSNEQLGRVYVGGRRGVQRRYRSCNRLANCNELAARPSTYGGAACMLQNSFDFNKEVLAKPDTH